MLTSITILSLPLKSFGILGSKHGLGKPFFVILLGGD